MAKAKRATWWKMFSHQRAAVESVSDDAAGSGLKAAFRYFDGEEISPEELSPQASAVGHIPGLGPEAGAIRHGPGDPGRISERPFRGQADGERLCGQSWRHTMTAPVLLLEAVPSLEKNHDLLMENADAAR